MLGSALVIGLGMGGIGLGLALCARALRGQDNPAADRIEALLPQTQCAQCTYPGCRPYAEAIATGEADINRCPPGGQDTIDALAKLLGRDSKPLSDDVNASSLRTVAVIREDICIGCKLCIKACPVDAILGTAKRMHTVIENECTGCELCVEPCPVDCIDMVTPAVTIQRWRRPLPIATGPA